jgi:hypothetical protein
MSNEASGLKYGLSRLPKKVDKILNQQAKENASTEPDDLARKRLEYAKQSAFLKALIEKLRTLSDEREQALHPPDKERLAIECERYYSMASLMGLSGLFDGMGLLADLSSLEGEDKDKDGKEVRIRISIADVLYDMAGFLERIERLMRKQNRMILEIGVKAKLFWVAKHDDEDDLAEPPNEPVAAGVGVSAEEIAASRVAPTDEQIRKAVKG